MALLEQDLRAIEAVLGATPAAAVAGELKRCIPGLAVMRCDAADVLEEPYRSYAGLDLHLIDGSSHCPKVTDDPLRAGGVLLAVRT